MFAWLLLALVAHGQSLEALDARGTAGIEAPPAAAGPPVVLSGGTILTATGRRIEAGWIALVDGRIEGLGEGAPPEVAGATVLDVTGQYVTPGLIDSHSHLGVYPSPSAEAHADGNEATDPVTPGVWAEHSVWPQDPGFQRAMAGGITTLQVLPGSANLVGGRGVTLHLVPTRGARAMRFPGAPETVKMACGENPKRNYESTGPSTRMGNLARQRTAFFEARAYLDEWEAFAEDHAEWEAKRDAPRRRKDPPPDDPPVPPARDLGKETLAGVLQGRILPQVHCYRADDMLAMLQLAEEVGFEVRSFHHAVEAYKIRDILAREEVSVSIWADWWGFKMEAFDGIPTNAALVAEAGGRAVLHSDSSIGIQRLNQEAAKAWRYGLAQGIDLPEDEALRWVTLNPAWTLGLEDEIGSLEEGKRADVVVWDGHPLSVYARARLVFVDGALRYDAERPRVWSDFLVGQEVAP